MPEQWIQDGKKFKRRWYINDAGKVPLKISSIATALNALLKDAKEHGVQIEVVKGKDCIPLNSQVHFNFVDTNTK